MDVILRGWENGVILRQLATVFLGLPEIQQKSSKENRQRPTPVPRDLSYFSKLSKETQKKRKKNRKEKKEETEKKEKTENKKEIEKKHQKKRKQ